MCCYLRYGDCHPIFYIGRLEAAITDALQCKARDVSWIVHQYVTGDIDLPLTRFILICTPQSAPCEGIMPGIYISYNSVAQLFGLINCLHHHHQTCDLLLITSPIKQSVPLDPVFHFRVLFITLKVCHSFR